MKYYLHLTMGINTYLFVFLINEMNFIYNCPCFFKGRVEQKNRPVISEVLEDDSE